MTGSWPDRAGRSDPRRWCRNLMGILSHIGEHLDLFSRSRGKNLLLLPHQKGTIWKIERIMCLKSLLNMFECAKYFLIS